MLEIRDLHVEVAGRELLHGIDLSVPRGEVHALLGPNGCGKTTLMMTIMGFAEYHVTGGQILFAGEAITELDITARARLGIGLAQQRPPTIPGVTLQHLIDHTMATQPTEPPSVSTLVETFHMNPFLGRAINAGLSGGEIKRSELFQLMLAAPKFAMMDEPDSGIDLESLALIGKMVATLFAKNSHCPTIRRTGLLITHTGYILDYVPVDRAHIMLDGKIVCSGNPQLMVEEIRRSGFEGCVRCLQEAALVTQI